MFENGFVGVLASQLPLSLIIADVFITKSMLCCVNTHPQRRTMQLISRRFLALLFPMSVSGYAGAGPAHWRAQCPRGPWDQQEGPQGLWHRVLGGGTSGDVTLLEVQRPCAGTEAGDTPDSAQFIICRTVISPPSSREVPVQAAGTDRSRVGFHTEGRFEIALSALQGPRPVCTCPYLGVASAPRASSWEGW